jgi:hypothetical protein
MAATTSGISERKIWGIVKEKEISGSIKSPSKKRNRKGIINKLNEEQKKLVRRCVHRFFLRNEPPKLLINFTMYALCRCENKCVNFVKQGKF